MEDMHTIDIPLPHNPSTTTNSVSDRSNSGSSLSDEVAQVSPISTDIALPVKDPGLNKPRSKVLYHPIKIKTGLVIYIPSSLPDNLQSFVDTSHLVVDKDLEVFKKSVNKMRAK